MVHRRYINNKGLHKDFVMSIKGIKFNDDKVRFIGEEPKKSLLERLFKKKKNVLKIETRGRPVRRAGVTFLF